MINFSVHRPWWTGDSGRFYGRIHLWRPLSLRLWILRLLVWPKFTGYACLCIPRVGGGYWPLLDVSFWDSGKLAVSNVVSDLRNFKARES